MAPRGRPCCETASTGSASSGSSRGKLLFAADDGRTGGELWTSDGTPEGTRLLRDIWRGANWSYPERIQRVWASELFFTAVDGRGPRALEDRRHRVGNRAWSGTSTTSAAAYPNGLLAVGSQLFFSAADASGGARALALRRHAEGTNRVKDIWPGAGGSDPGEFRALGDKLLFAADDGQHGRELWISDGTEAGTTTC